MGRINHTISLKAPNSKREAFTLIEVLISLTLTALLARAGIPLVMDSYRTYLLASEVRTAVSIMRRAESFAMSNQGQSAHGVRILADQFLLFRGASYASRTQAYDEAFPRLSGITISGPDEVVFASVSGLPSATGTIGLSNGPKSANITVNSQGSISF